ncbi:MAG: ABC transporter substrate-binding protein [Microscillaceae bacterium]|nr:ABC transporter substrate-binding protein [Microscillaceae bacterium]
MPTCPILVFAKIRAGTVKDVSNAQGVLNLESILALKPDLVVFSGLSVESFRQNQALASAGIPLLINSEWLETTPLGRAEWIKMMALFFEPTVFQKAVIHFENVEENYLALQEKTKMVRPRPKVLWQVPYKDTWYVPGGESYVARLLQDAGGDYLWKNEKGTASLPFDFETVYARRKEADFWISLGTVRTKKELKDIDARFADFKPFANGQLYNDHRQANPQGGNPYWMQGVVYPDKVLADLIKILHPGLLPKHAWVFFKK